MSRPRPGRAEVGRGRSLKPLELPEWFPRFMNPGADRFEELRAALYAAGCTPRPLELGGGRFILVAPKNSLRDPRYRMKVITAHHDRVPGTPGALDNSAACLQLWRFVTGSREQGDKPQVAGTRVQGSGTPRAASGPGRRPKRERFPESGPAAFNTVAIFTDREELSGSPVEEQGAYALGKAFPDLGLGRPLVLSLDVTGRGDALVLSSSCSGLAGLPGLRGEGARLDAWGRGRGESPAEPVRPSRIPVREAVSVELESLAEGLAKHLAGRIPVHRVPVPFGEDIGFLLAGIPALVCTVLPRREAQSLSIPAGLPQWASPVRPQSRQPQTWRYLHGPDDTVELYTDSAFALMEGFLERVAALKLGLESG